MITENQQPSHRRVIPVGVLIPSYYAYSLKKCIIVFAVAGKSCFGNIITYYILVQFLQFHPVQHNSFILQYPRFLEHAGYLFAPCYIRSRTSSYVKYTCLSYLMRFLAASVYCQDSNLLIINWDYLKLHGYRRVTPLAYYLLYLLFCITLSLNSQNSFCFVLYPVNYIAPAAF